MSPKPSICLEIEADLLAAATGESDPPAARRVEQHVGRCAPCLEEFEQYRAIDRLVDELRGVSLAGPDAALARQRLEARLADLRGRLLTYCVFPSPLGRILIACSDQGVSLLEYLGSGTGLRASRLQRIAGVEAREDGAAVEAFCRELLEYLEGKRTRLEWPLDFRLARSEFQRRVLQATANIPYGAVVSYTGIAWKVGGPASCRAVAQALRWNPLPIVVPCHRVIGASGSLTGYAGNRVALKQKLLATEGIPIAKSPRDMQILRKAMYVRYPGDGAYCLPTCSSLSSLTPSRLTLFGSRERAEDTGLRPCTECRPDLHPISR